MSNNQFFSTANSNLTFKRLNDADEHSQRIEQMIDFGKGLGLEESLLAVLRDETSVDSKTLTADEIQALRNAVEVADLKFFGVSVDKYGIHINGGEQGTLYDLEEKFGLVFNAVKDTVVFNGAVEVHGSSIEEHSKITVEDSVITSYEAEINWVKSS